MATTRTSVEFYESDYLYLPQSVCHSSQSVPVLIRFIPIPFSRFVSTSTFTSSNDYKKTNHKDSKL